MNNRWELQPELRQKYSLYIEEYLNKLDAMSVDEIEHSLFENVILDLSDTGLSPYTLGLLLSEFGYEKIKQENNGWEMDLWIRLNRKGHNNCLSKYITIDSCGQTFKLHLYPTDIAEC